MCANNRHPSGRSIPWWEVVWSWIVFIAYVGGAKHGYDKGQSLWTLVGMLFAYGAVFFLLRPFARLIGEAMEEILLAIKEFVWDFICIEVIWNTLCLAGLLLFKYPWMILKKTWKLLIVVGLALATYYAYRRIGS